MEARQDKELQQAEVELLLKDMLPHVYTKVGFSVALSNYFGGESLFALRVFFCLVQLSSHS